MPVHRPQRGSPPLRSPAWRSRANATAGALIGLFAGLSLVACQLDVDIDTAPAPSDVKDGPDRAMGPVTDGGPEPNAASADAGSDGGTQGPAKHRLCNVALPDELPPAPPVASDATGRPLFDRWRDYECEALPAVERCDPASLADGGSSCSECLVPVPGEPGYCTPNAADDARDSLVTFRDGVCSVAASVVAKAALCCADTERFDCRPWPFATDSSRGGLCSVHADCEPGLVCKAQSPAYVQEFGWINVGLCVCPNERADALEGLPDCRVTTW